MSKHNKGILAAVAALSAIACDPYKKENTDPPQIGFTVATVDGVGTSGTAAAVVPQAVCHAGATPTNDAPAAQLFIKMVPGKLLDGSTIESSRRDPQGNWVADCTPAGAWLTVTPAAPPGFAWYSCYNPSSPRPEEGSSIVIYRAPAVSTTTPASGNWLEAETLQASTTVVTPYRFTGNVRDKQGQVLAVDVTMNVAPNPGVPGDPTFTYAAGPSVVLAWTAADCGSAATYRIERAPNEPSQDVPPVDQPGKWADLAGAGAVAGLTYTDATVTTGSKYWYRVTGKTASLFEGGTSGEAMATVP